MISYMHGYEQSNAINVTIGLLKCMILKFYIGEALIELVFEVVVSFTLYGQIT